MGNRDYHICISLPFSYNLSSKSIQCFLVKNVWTWVVYLHRDVEIARKGNERCPLTFIDIRWVGKIATFFSGTIWSYLHRWHTYTWVTIAIIDSFHRDSIRSIAFDWISFETRDTAAVVRRRTIELCMLSARSTSTCAASITRQTSLLTRKAVVRWAPCSSSAFAWTNGGSVRYLCSLKAWLARVFRTRRRLRRWLYCSNQSVLISPSVMHIVNKRVLIVLNVIVSLPVVVPFYFLVNYSPHAGYIYFKLPAIWSRKPDERHRGVT